MIKYSKPIGNLFDFKWDFIDENDQKLERFKEIAKLYGAQPRRESCKVCDQPLTDDLPNFDKLGVRYFVCSTCGHVSGAFEDSEEFCAALYTDSSGSEYARNYTASDIEAYQSRMREIYVPKAEFMRDALEELGEDPMNLNVCDLGAGAGYFVGAVDQLGFKSVQAHEPSETMVHFGNQCLGKELLKVQNANDVVKLAGETNCELLTFIGVLEHIREMRATLKAAAENRSVKYIYFQVPMFSPTVALEVVMNQVMPRHLVAGHTHLFTDSSINHFCHEFGFTRCSEWWFGLEAADIWRSMLVMLKKDRDAGYLVNYWEKEVFKLIDGIQHGIDQAKMCTDVHILLRK